MELTADERRLCAEVRATCACTQLRRTTRGITAVYDAALAPSGLKATQLPILVALGSAGPLSMTRLADVLALDRTTLTRNLGLLEQRGLIGSRVDEGDARVRVVSLAPAGSRALTEALARWQDVQHAVEEEFGRERLRALHGELAALAAAVGTGGER